MPPRKLVYAYLFFWMTLGIVVFVASVQTCLGALHGTAHGPAGVHLGLLAGVEAIAALLFLIPRTMRVGGVLLLVTFGIALSAHAAAGEFPSQLLLYAAGTIFVLAHGPVPMAWLKGPGSTQRHA